MHVLLVGGLGYIGRHVAYELTQQGIKVTTLDRKWPLNTKLYSGEKYVYGDIIEKTVAASIFGELEGIDAIIHLAALIDAPQSVRMASLYYEVNFSGTLNVLRMAQMLNVKRFIFASSAAVYGKESCSPHTEDAPILNPENPYGGSKLFGERLVRDMCNGKIANTSFRFFNVVGSNPKVGTVPSNKGLFSRVVAAHSDNEPFSIYGTDHPTDDGYAVRDFVNVRDIARAIYMATTISLPNDVPPLTYNLGSGKGTSVKQVVDASNRLFRFTTLKPEILPARAGEVPLSIASIDKVKKELGWEPIWSHDFTDALQQEYDARAAIYRNEN